MKFLFAETALYTAVGSYIFLANGLAQEARRNIERGGKVRQKRRGRKDFDALFVADGEPEALNSFLMSLSLSLSHMLATNKEMVMSYSVDPLGKFYKYSRVPGNRNWRRCAVCQPTGVYSRMCVGREPSMQSRPL